MDTALLNTEGRGKKNISVILDFHYCSKNLNDYPTAQQNEIALIRLCSRPEDIKKAIKFGQALKEHTGLKVSFNVIKISNYSTNQILYVGDLLSSTNFDMVCFADTHGGLELFNEKKDLIKVINNLKASSKSVGMHMHNHSGKVMANYTALNNYNIDFVDTTIRGLGKGGGNLRLEHVIEKNYLQKIVNLIVKYDDLLVMKFNPYCLITCKYSVSDSYAKQGLKYGINILEFDEFCSTITQPDKDLYNEFLIKNANV